MPFLLVMHLVGNVCERVMYDHHGNGNPVLSSTKNLIISAQFCSARTCFSGIVNHLPGIKFDVLF